jgi:uncharacterized metal-binding protein YceD (DUF177 family)
MTQNKVAELPVLSLKQVLTDLAAAGRDIKLSATPDERKRIASALGVVEIPKLTATLLLESTRKGARLSGEIAAEVVQACIVTLEPVTQHIAEDITVEFAHADSEPAAHESVEIDPEAPDPPDPIIGGVIDIGKSVEEHLALALDPYPRAQNAEIPADYRATKMTPSQSPFSALEALRDGGASKPRDTSSESND